MKIRWLIVLVLLVSFLTSCACYPPGKLKELEREMVATKAGVYKLIQLKEQERRQQEICRKLSIPEPGKRAAVATKLKKMEGVEEKPISTTPESEDKSWVFRATKAGDKIKIMVNKNRIRSLKAGETVYWVGDQQGWFSKQYPMELAGDAYVTYMPIANNTGRHRSNFVILNEGPVHSVRDWGNFEPSNDPKWVRRGDLTPDGHYAYCIMFYIQPDGQVTPTN